MADHSANNSMLLVHYKAQDVQGTFSLIPLCPERAPFLEAIYYPQADGQGGTLAIVSTHAKAGLTQLPKLDPNGHPIPQSGKGAIQGQAQMQRQTVDMYYEYFVTNPDDIRALVELVAINVEHPMYQSFFGNVSAPVSNYSQNENRSMTEDEQARYDQQVQPYAGLDSDK